MTKIKKSRMIIKNVLKFGNSKLGFVSDFDIRISDLKKGVVWLTK